MKQIDIITVDSANDPSIEWDVDFRAVYIRFKSRATKVVKTLDRSRRGHTVTIDLDKNNQVIGIEAIPADVIQVDKVLKMARVEAPRVDWSRSVFKTTNEVLSEV